MTITAGVQQTDVPPSQSTSLYVSYHSLHLWSILCRTGCKTIIQSIKSSFTAVTWIKIKSTRFELWAQNSTMRLLTRLSGMRWVAGWTTYLFIIMPKQQILVKTHTYTKAPINYTKYTKTIYYLLPGYFCCTNVTLDHMFNYIFSHLSLIVATNTELTEDIITRTTQYNMKINMLHPCTLYRYSCNYWQGEWFWRNLTTADVADHNLDEPGTPADRSLPRSWSASRCAVSNASVCSSKSRCSLRLDALTRATSSSDSSSCLFSCFTRLLALSTYQRHQHNTPAPDVLQPFITIPSQLCYHSQLPSNGKSEFFRWSVYICGAAKRAQHRGKQSGPFFPQQINLPLI